MIKSIAIYLPQFHPIPENDEWWGKGFTEWTNVAKAQPLFKGHYQPHLPADLGFYDLRLSEAREEQASLASAYGIDGFCYYHYWFSGKRLLHAPIDGIVKTKKPDFPFMLCWANENWTRRWDGKEQEVLIHQTYSETDDLAHIRFLIKQFFSDSRYIKVEGKPFFLIYRPALFPDIKKTLDLWRDEANRSGLKGLYLGYMQSFNFKESPTAYGFDCAVEFQPDFTALPTRLVPSLKQRILNMLNNISNEVYYKNTVISFQSFVEGQLQKNTMEENIYKTVSPMWDNSPRRQHKAYIFTESTPDIYEKWLRHVVSLTLNSSQQEKFVFINAWNEWAEGNHLEPCMKWGRGYLEATKRALQNA